MTTHNRPAQHALWYASRVCNRNRILLLVAIGLCLAGWFRFLSWDRATGLRTMPVFDATGQELSLDHAEFRLGTVVDGDFAYQVRSEETESIAADGKTTHLVRYDLRTRQGQSVGILPNHNNTVGFAAGKDGQRLLAYESDKNEVWAGIFGSDTDTPVPTGVLGAQGFLMLVWADDKLQFATDDLIVSVDEHGVLEQRKLKPSFEFYQSAFPDTERSDRPWKVMTVFHDDQWWLHYENGTAISEAGNVRQAAPIENLRNGDVSVLGLVEGAGDWRLLPDFSVELNPASPKTKDATSGSVKGYEIVDGHLASKSVWRLRGKELDSWQSLAGKIHSYENLGNLHLVDDKYLHIHFPSEEVLRNDSSVLRFSISWLGRATRASFIPLERSGVVSFLVTAARANEILCIGLNGQYLALDRQSLERTDPLPWRHQMRITAATKFFGLQVELLYMLLAGAPAFLLFALGAGVVETRKRRRVPLRVEVRTNTLSSIISQSKSEKVLSVGLVMYLIFGFVALIHLWPLMP